MQWWSQLVWGFNGNGAAATGAGGLSAGLFGSSSVGLGTGVGGSTMGGAPVSPASMSAASIAPHWDARTGVGRLTLERAPESPTSLSRAACGARTAPVSPATVSVADIAPRPGANQPRSPLAMPMFIPIRTAPAPQTTGTSGGVGENRAAGTFVHENLNSSVEPESNRQLAAAVLGMSSSVSTGGRRKGQLREQAKSCHGCRTNKPRQGIKYACVDGRDPRCNYWLCKSCFKEWTEASGVDGFLCCLHRGKQWCPCNSRKRVRRGPVPALERSALAKSRIVSTSIFEFPARTRPALTVARTTPSATPTGGAGKTYSVCTSVGLQRVAVIKTGDEFICSRKNCRGVKNPQASAAATGGTDSALPAPCCHAEVVLQAERSSMPMPTADPLFSPEEFRHALTTAVPAGAFSEGTTRAMHARADQAAEDGVPVLVGLGSTKYFGITDGLENNRKVVGGWAHVKYDDRDGSKFFQCKVGERFALDLRWLNVGMVEVLL
ncbi:unnamed protein product [Ectocarpus sp. 6 AP-2014]